MVWSSVIPRDGSNLLFRARNAMKFQAGNYLVILKTIHYFHHPVRPRSNIEHTLVLYRAFRTLAHSRDRWLEHHRARGHPSEIRPRSASRLSSWGSCSQRRWLVRGGSRWWAAGEK